MIILSVFNRKHPFFGQVLCEKSNSLLKMKLSSKTNSNMWDSVVILCLFSFLYQKNILFGLILSKISKFAIFVEIWYVDYFEYVKIDSGGHFSVLDLFLQVLSEKCIRHLDVTFLILISKQFTPRDLKPVAFLVSVKYTNCHVLMREYLSTLKSRKVPKQFVLLKNVICIWTRDIRHKPHGIVLETSWCI